VYAFSYRTEDMPEEFDSDLEIIRVPIPD